MAAKVLHLSTVHPIDDLRMFQKEVRSLRAAGWNVIVAGIGMETIAADIEPACIFERPTSRTQRMLSTIPRVIEICKREKPDILHFHDPEILAALPFVRGYCGRIVFDSHEHISEQIQNKPYIPVPLRPIIGHGVAFVERQMLRYVDAVVAPTPHIVEFFQRQGKETIQIANYPDRASMPDFTDMATRQPQAVYTGRISNARGLPAMLEAAKNLKAELHLAGMVDGECQAALKDAQEQPFIHFHGWMPRREAFELQQNSMVGIQVHLATPQYRTAIPTKVFEYFAMGLVVICTDLPFLREVFAGFPTIRFVDPTDVAGIQKAWAEAIERYPRLTDDLLFSREKVMTEFTWESQASKLLALYSKWY